MRCPKCDLEMSHKEFDDVPVDRCFGCGGIWVEKKAYEAIEQKNIASLVDIVGLTAKAEQMDELSAHCHKCDNDMMSIPGNNDVNFDWCDSCDGMFFDRGELAGINEKD